MSELDVIVIHIRAEQAAEYERLFAERELPRWREYKVELLEPGSASCCGSPTHSSRRLRWCTADRCCTLPDRRIGVCAGVPQCGPPGAPADKAAGNAIPGRSSGRPGQPHNRRDGRQPLGLITERDERMKCLYVTASPAESECLNLMRDPRRSPRA